MKSSTKVLAAVSIAAASFSYVHATTVIRVTGSTAFRKAFYFAAVNSLSNVQVASYGTSSTNGVNTSNDWSGSGRVVITGKGLGGAVPTTEDVVIECTFAGSVGGLQATVQGLTTIPLLGSPNAAGTTWLAASNTASAPAVTQDTAAGTLKGFFEVKGTVPTAVWDSASAPDVAMSDAFQSSTPYKTPKLIEASVGPLGVIDFNWVKGKKPTTTNTDPNNGLVQADLDLAYAHLTNISALQARKLLSSGYLNLSSITGNTVDAFVDVVLVGRNNDSGTRLVTQAEAGYGYGTATEKQYLPTISGGVITGLPASPTDVGYNSGGNVVTALSTAQANDIFSAGGSPFILVGYMGAGDTRAVTGTTPTAVGANQGQQLTFNGVLDGALIGVAANKNLETGSYSFWSYEHAYYRAGLADVAGVSYAKSVMDLISANIRNTYASQSGTKMTDMQPHSTGPAGSPTSRTIEGGAITPASVF